MYLAVRERQAELKCARDRPLGLIGLACFRPSPLVAPAYRRGEAEVFRGVRSLSFLAASPVLGGPRLLELFDLRERCADARILLLCGAPARCAVVALIGDWIISVERGAQLLDARCGGDL